MKKSAHFLNNRDVQMRLYHSLIRYKGSPVYIIETEGTNVVAVTAEDPPNKIKFNANSPHVNLSSPPLGMCNFKSNGFFIERSPLRMQKLGISRDNTSGLNLSTLRPTVLNQDFFTSPKFTDMIHGEYPDFGASLRQIYDGKCGSRGFSRFLGLAKDKNTPKNMKLFCHRRYVGNFNAKRDVIELTRSRSPFLIRELEKYTGGVPVVMKEIEYDPTDESLFYVSP